jgi:hypothetical protein
VVFSWLMKDVTLRNDYDLPEVRLGGDPGLEIWLRVEAPEDNAANSFDDGVIVGDPAATRARTPAAL